MKDSASQSASEWKRFLAATKKRRRSLVSGTTRRDVTTGRCKSIFSQRQHAHECKAASSLFPLARFGNQLAKISELRKWGWKKGWKGWGRGKKGKKLGCNIVAVGKFHRYGVRVNYWFQNGPATPSHPLTPLFKAFLVYAREIVLLTQFSVTRFRVNRAGARVRNNSLLKWCSINELPISFSISSNRTFSVSMGKKKGGTGMK